MEVHYGSYRSQASLAGSVVSVALFGVLQSSAIPAPVKAVPAPVPDTLTTSAHADGEMSMVGTGVMEATGTAPSASQRASLAATNSSPTAQAVCTFTMNGDYVHVSSSAPREASGHGWWVNGNCRATLADVTVQLQQYYSDGSWRSTGTVGRARVRSGGGAGNRATGRAGCNSTSLTGWRSVIDVDVVGIVDDPNKAVTSGRNISCRR